jgi:pimeloyl-ACP methyl ester carboxylesterase
MAAQGATEVHLVGDGLGANLALVAAADDARVKDVALIDAGLNLDGVKLPTPLATYGARPVLFVTSSGDAYAVRSADLLQPKAQGPNDVLVVPGAGQLAAMLVSDPQVTSVVLSWVAGTYFLSEGELDKARTNLTTGDTTGIQTKGKSFGER